jgi:multidrug efflux pump
LIFSQMLTLYTTPVIYLYMDRLRLWLRSGAVWELIKDAWRKRHGRQLGSSL